MIFEAVMLSRLMLVMLLCCQPLAARELSESELEPVLSRSAKIFDSLSLAELAYALDRQHHEYVFSLCLLENGDWGVSPFAQDTGYWMNQGNQQIEVFNCQTTISLKEYMMLSLHIFNQRAEMENGVRSMGDRAQWTMKGLRPCYNKKAGDSIASICHVVPGCPSCQINDNPATIGSQVKYLAGFMFIVVSVVLGYLRISHEIAHAFGRL